MYFLGVLVIADVSKSYGDEQVLRDVSLNAEPGEIVGLLGPNGAGKTTLVSIIAGLRRADAGTVSIGGCDLASQRAQAIPQLAIAPQDTGVQLLLTGRQNLEFATSLAGLSSHETKAQITRVADGLELGSFLDKRTSLLSGGQRRRIHAGCAIVTRPKLLLLDEPTVGADLEMRSQLLGVVRELADAGTTVIYTTHYLPEVEELNARVVILEAGAVLIDASLDSFLDDHASSFVELSFDGPAPDIELAGLSVVRQDSIVRAEGPGVAARTAELITSLGDHSQRLRGVEVLRPNLDTAYLALTGQRFQTENGQ